MVQTPGELILPRGIRENATIVFKLVHQEGVPRSACGINGKNLGQDPGACGRRQGWLAGKTWDRCGTFGSQPINDGCLLITGKLSSVRTELICIEQNRDGVLCILAVAFECEEHEGLVLDPGKAECQTILLAAQRVLGRSCNAVWQCRIESLSRLQRLAEGERIPSIENIVAEEAIETAMAIVRAGLGNDIDGRAGRAAEISAVIAAV